MFGASQTWGFSESLPAQVKRRNQSPRAAFPLPNTKRRPVAQAFAFFASALFASRCLPSGPCFPSGPCLCVFPRWCAKRSTDHPQHNGNKSPPLDRLSRRSFSVGGPPPSPFIPNPACGDDHRKPRRFPVGRDLLFLRAAPAVTPVSSRPPCSARTPHPRLRPCASRQLHARRRAFSPHPTSAHQPKTNPIAHACGGLSRTSLQGFSGVGALAPTSKAAKAGALAPEAPTNHTANLQLTTLAF